MARALQDRPLQPRGRPPPAVKGPPSHPPGGVVLVSCQPRGPDSYLATRSAAETASQRRGDLRVGDEGGMRAGPRLATLNGPGSLGSPG
eukprot:12376389-Alexandrium_andersonii.AAC.1